MKLHIVNPNDVVIPPNRQRKEFPPEKIVELASSISKNGLINPITVRREGDATILVAGERRIKAILYLWQFGELLCCGGYEFLEGQIPAVYLHELDPLRAELLEYAENVDRDDLTWQERAKATRRMAEIEVQLAKKEGREQPTIAELSNQIKGSDSGGAQDATRKEIIVAKFLDDPDVAAAKDTDEAFKVIKRKEETRKNAELAITIGRSFTAAVHQLYNVDCREWLVKCPPETFDIVLTDPPYGMGADEFGDSGGMAAGAHGYVDNYIGWQALTTSIMNDLFRIAKLQSHCYIFCDLDKFHELKGYMQAAGWKVFRTPIVWHKPNGMRAPWPQQGPFRRYELILYAVKGDKPVTKLCPDVVSYPSDQNLGHAAQKPIDLYLDLLRRSCRPGDSVLDFACGSGTIFPACHELKCKATGLEIDPAAYGLATKRLGELK